MLSLQARVDLETMAMKGYSAFSKVPAFLESHHQMVLVSYLGHTLGSLTPQQRCSQCILQTQPTAPQFTFNSIGTLFHKLNTIEGTA